MISVGKDGRLSVRIFGFGVVRHLGWVFWLIDLAVIVTGIAVFISAPRSNAHGALVGTIAMVTAFFAFPTMGALIIWNRPRNTIEWIFCAIGLGTAFTSFSAAVAQHALANKTDSSFIVGVVDALGNSVCTLRVSSAFRRS
jgi:hypothetical protein